MEQPGLAQKPLSIIILSLNRTQALKRCIQSLFAHTKIPFEVILLDNGSSDSSTIEYCKSLKRHKNIKVIFEPANLGCAGGRKKALTFASGNYIITLDNDMELTEGWAEALLLRINQDKRIGAVCSKVIYPNEMVETNGGHMEIINNRFVRFNLIDQGKHFRDPETMQEHECDWVHGGATMIRKEVLSQATISEEFINGFEDNDFSWQLKKKGYRLVNCPNAIVIHHHNNFLNENEQQQEKFYINIRNNPQTLWLSLRAFYKRHNLIIKDETLYDFYGLKGLSDNELYDFFRDERFPRLPTKAKQMEHLPTALSEYSLLRYRRLRDKALPVMTWRRGVYEWFIKQGKVLINCPAQQPLGETLISRYRRLRNKLFPWDTPRRVVYSCFIGSIKKTIKDFTRHPSRKFLRYETRNKPFISVVIPVYDRTDILRECIESILNQTYPDFELLLVCDGSPPETLEVVTGYESHPKVRVFKYKDNSGNAVRGRNKGIREARGKYLAFIDSDDIAEPDRLKISCWYAEENNADLVYGAFKVKKEKGSPHSYLFDGQAGYSPYYDYLSLQQANPICQSTVLAKTDVLRKAGGYKSEMRYCEDYELWLRLVYLGYKFEAIPEILVTFRLHSANAENRFQKDEALWIQKALTEHKNIPQLKPS